MVLMLDKVIMVCKSWAMLFASWSLHLGWSPPRHCHAVGEARHPQPQQQADEH